MPSDALIETSNVTPASEFGFVELVQKFLKNPNPLIKQLEEYAYLSPRHPDASNKSTTILCPTVESMGPQFLSLITDEQGKLDKHKLNNLKSRAQTHGLMFYADGIKVQDASSGNNAYGDLYIATNLDILYLAAKRLQCDIIYGIYSGDENCGLALIPQNTENFKDREELDQTFHAECDKLINSTYQNSSHKHAEEFAHMQQSIKDHGYDQDKLGFKLHTHALANVTIPVSPQNDSIRLRSLTSIILDLARGKTLPKSSNEKSLIDSLFDTLEKEITSHQEPAIVLSRIPHKFRKIHDDLVAHNLIKTTENALDANTVNQDKVIGLLEHAVFEPIFPRDMLVRKKSTLIDDIKDGIAAGKTYHTVSFANTEVKGQNEVSHLHGDNEIIASFDVIQRYIEHIQTESRKSISAHDGIKYYQSQGSGLMLIEDSVYQQIKNKLADCLAINTYAATHPGDPGLTVYPTHPFVVTSLSNHPIGKDFDEKEFWKYMDTGARSNQLTNETLYTLLVAGLLNQVPRVFIEEIALLLEISLDDSLKWTESLTTSQVINFFSSMFDRYTAYRPPRKDVAKEWIITHPEIVEQLAPHHSVN